jgi:regulator of protease activity HflC (stomatin/prohibitin superfamily)
MSYSFGVRAATKAEVAEKIAAELDKVVAAQPVHAADRAQAQAAAEAFLGILPEKPTDQDFYVSVSGSVSWKADKVLTSAGVNISASLSAKEKA